METKIIHAFYGRGRGKTSAALGQALRDLNEDERVTVIQFLKGKGGDEFSILKRLEPEVQFFRFDKSDSFYRDLSIEEKEEEKQNILNGVHFARKVIETGESDIIVLDELLGVLDLGILDTDQVKELLMMEGDYRKLYVTGNNLPDELTPYFNVISEIDLKKDETV
ncbi:MAG TPA: cob(I)yrinic acid a c-diamide adenosyltransferase [Lachnospiraceae bacterium]|nr:cob(I)yrinic acid a,c-diamide adenosyltransferase [Eubacterium sp.]HAK57344.1 cob(I)yrinic acid a c-diamide adenosyltransferase [Lachnospiraceae bacterium]